jgi:hypothetical protein
LKLHKHLARENANLRVPGYRNGLDEGGAPLMLQALVGTHSLSSKNEFLAAKKRKNLPPGFEKPIPGISLE